MSVQPFIEAERAEQRGSVKRACELLEVSRAAYYESRQAPSRRQLDDDELTRRIEPIYAESRGKYGWPRVHRALRREGVHVSGKRVARGGPGRDPHRLDGDNDGLVCESLP